MTNVEGIYLPLFCDSCDDDGQTNTARSFCFDCEKYICSGCEKWHAKFSRNHKTIAGDDLPEAKELGPLMQCASHAKHSVEFYCEEHQLVFCRLCRHIKHGDCAVKDFVTACQEFDLEIEFSGAVENLQNAIGQINEAKDRGLRQLERFEQEAEERKPFIRNFRRQLDELFDRYENAGEEYDRANMERENAVLESVNVYLRQTEERMRLLEETEGQLEEDAIFVSIIKSNQLCKEYTSKVEDIVADAKEYKPFSFYDENVSTLLEKLTLLTHAEQTCSDEAELGEATRDSKMKSFWNIQACSLIKDSVVTAGDGKCIFIAACLTMANGEMILCDYTNQRMVLMNKSLKILSDINIQGRPFNVAEIDDNTVALTCPKQKRLHLVTIKPGLKHKKQIETDQECNGIALHDKKLFVCTLARYPYEVMYGFQILSVVNWDILKRINIVNDASPEFISPSSNGTNVFLSGGFGQVPIVCISKEGHIIYKYFDDTFESPKNIFADDDDNLLVLYVGNRVKGKTGLRVIKSGGGCSKDLPLQKENLGKITALHIDQRSDILLVASEDQVDGKTVSKLRMFKLEY